MARKLVVLFDGTWNNEGSNTNVVRMRDAIPARLASAAPGQARGLSFGGDAGMPQAASE